MRGLVVTSTLAIILALLMPNGGAEGFNLVVDDDKVKIKLDYPVEVRSRECFEIRVDVTALQPITGLNLSLKLRFHGDGLSTIILDEEVLRDVDVSSPRVIVFKTINVCLPSAEPRDPIVEAEVTAEYISGGEEFEIVSRFFMSIVRDKLYDELAAELSSAKREIARLREIIKSLDDKIDSLLAEIAVLRSKLRDASLEAKGLKNAYEKLKLRYVELNNSYAELAARYEELKGEMDRLNDRYIKLVSDYGSLRSIHESLRGDYETLNTAYQELRRDYESVVRDLSSLQSLYNELDARHKDLRRNYEESIRIIGELRGKLREKEREATNLRMSLEDAVEEGGLVKILAAAQAAGIASLGTYTYLRSKNRGIRRIKGGDGDRPRDGEGEGHSDGNSSVDEGHESRKLRVLAGRRVTIPAEFAEQLGISIGGLVKASLSGDYIVLRRVTDEPKG